MSTFIFRIFFFFSVLCININAQEQEWINLNPFDQPPGNTLYGVDFLDEHYGWAVGEWGIILHTNDGGDTWQVLQNYTIDYHLYSVDFINHYKGWTVGNYGIILYTDNSGQTWQEQTSSTEFPLNDVIFINDSTGWAVGYGGLALHTNDGGKIWNIQTTPTEHELRGVTFINMDSGWATGTYGTILHTTDGGQNWVEQNSGVEWHLDDITFVDSLYGWSPGFYSGEDGVLHTIDGGKTWQKVLTEGYGRGISAVSINEVWIVGKDGLIKHTDDGGKSWYTQNSNTEKYLWDVTFIDNDTGWAVGSSGIILHTEDGGKNWLVQQKRDVSYYLSGTFVDAKKGWLLAWGQNVLYHTVNGGDTWLIKLEEDSMYFNNIWFVNDMNGWIKVYNGTPFGGPNVPYLLRTTNSGDSWQEVSKPPDSAFYALHFVDSLIGYSGGDNAIYRTTDGGETWQPGIIQPETRFGINDIYFIDKQNGWAVGLSGEWFDGGIILKTTNGGEIWQVNQDPSGVTGRAVYFTDSLSGYVVGSNPPFFDSVIMSTKDGGKAWATQYISDVTGGSWINDVVLIDDSAGWCVGDYGYIWYTEDAGESWQRINSDTNADLNRIVFVDSGQVGYIFGDDNTLLKIEREINSINDDHSFSPSTFKLFQNYPNPFNSQTVITYELNKTIFVQLKVYDLTGKEVVTLINGKQTAGSYHLSWNGKNKNGKEVSSGIYFFELRVGSYSQIRKMVLIR